MKKIYIAALLIAAATLTGCGKKADNAEIPEAQQEQKPIASEIAETVVGENKEVQTGEVAESGLAGAVKKINADAVVEQSINPGMRMLKIELPISANKERTFFEQVKKVIEECKLNESQDFDFFFFSTSENGVIQISAAFKNIMGEFSVESVNGIGDEYKNAAATAAEVSEIFVKAE